MILQGLILAWASISSTAAGSPRQEYGRLCARHRKVIWSHPG